MAVEWSSLPVFVVRMVEDDSECHIGCGCTHADENEEGAAPSGGADGGVNEGQWGFPGAASRVRALMGTDSFTTGDSPYRSTDPNDSIIDRPRQDRRERPPFASLSFETGESRTDATDDYSFLDNRIDEYDSRLSPAPQRGLMQWMQWGNPLPDKPLVRDDPRLGKKGTYYDDHELIGGGRIPPPPNEPNIYPTLHNPQPAYIRAGRTRTKRFSWEEDRPYIQTTDYAEIPQGIIATDPRHRRQHTPTPQRPVEQIKFPTRSTKSSLEKQKATTKKKLPQVERNKGKQKDSYQNNKQRGSKTSGDPSQKSGRNSKSTGRSGRNSNEPDKANPGRARSKSRTRELIRTKPEPKPKSDGKNRSPKKIASQRKSGILTRKKK